MHRSLLKSTLIAALALAEVFVLLVVELISAMLVYIYLNLYHLQTFGHLVRIARYVLDALVGQLEYWLPGSANSAYATLVGELGPKSILLLIIGLLVAAGIRFLVRWVARVASRGKGDHVAQEA
jgi:hypothetical protein